MLLLTTDLLSCQNAPDGQRDAAGAGRPGQEIVVPGGATTSNWGSSPLNPIQYCKKKDERAGESLQTILIKACTIFCLPKSRQSVSLRQDISGLSPAPRHGQGEMLTWDRRQQVWAEGRGCLHGFSPSPRCQLEASPHLYLFFFSSYLLASQRESLMRCSWLAASSGAGGRRCPPGEYLGVRRSLPSLLLPLKELSA